MTTTTYTTKQLISFTTRTGDKFVTTLPDGRTIRTPVTSAQSTTSLPKGWGIRGRLAHILH